jgi:long-chain acyl-CoA synthetase
MDERGALFFIDRCKDVIVVSGFKVWPGEVEEVIMMLPGVKEVGVVGIPDTKSGEAVRGYVVKKEPALSAEAVITHCHANLAAYKAPKEVVFRDRLPKSPIGKILRRKLKEEQAASGEGRAGGIRGGQ